MMHLDEPRQDVAAALEAHLACEGTPLDSELYARARAGHSPSVRLLVNASDDVVALAELSAKAAPAGLRSRIVDRVAAESGAGGVASVALDRSGSLFRPANETVGILHRQAEGDAARIAGVSEVWASDDESPIDRSLALLLGQVHPFFDFEVVIVSVVVAEHTVHRVSRGLPTDGSLRVVPRELSFCTHTVSAGEPFVVEDGEEEAFFRGSVLVRELGVRAYLGVPLVIGGVILGSLCALSRRRQAVDVHDVALMAQFAGVAQGLITAGAATCGVHARARMTALIEAQRARVRARPSDHPTSLLRTPREVFDRLELPEHLVVGEADDGAGVVILVPASHPGYAQLDAIVGGDGRITSEPLA